MAKSRSKFAANTNHAFLKLDNRTLGTYNLHDANETAKLVAPLTQELQSNGQWNYYTSQVEPLQYAVLAMQKRGLLVDRDRLTAIRRGFVADLQDTDRSILAADSTGELAAPTARARNSLGSRAKLRRFLFEQLGLKATKKTETGLDSTDQESLFRILRDLRKKDEHARPVLEALFHRSRLQTMLSRYMAFDIDPDGRVRARVKMYGTKTMRFAYAQPALQQFPPELWDVFVARPGHLFLAGDYSQLEAKLLAYLAGDRASIEVFEKGGDVHTANACDLFGYSEGVEISKGERTYAKTFLYGLSYGGAAESMKLKTYCPCPRCKDKVPPVFQIKRAEIKSAERRWFARHPTVRKFQRATAEQVSRCHYYESPLVEGAKRYLTAPWSKDLDREVKNLPMQFGGALLMNGRQVELHKMGAPIVLQRHDEFMLEIPESPGRVVDQWAADVRGIMEAPISGLGGVQFNVSVEVGKSWGSLETLG